MSVLRHSSAPSPNGHAPQLPANTTLEITTLRRDRMPQGSVSAKFSLLERRVRIGKPRDFRFHPRPESIQTYLRHLGCQAPRVLPLQRSEWSPRRVDDPTYALMPCATRFCSRSLGTSARHDCGAPIDLCGEWCGGHECYSMSTNSSTERPISSIRPRSVPGLRSRALCTGITSRRRSDARK